MTTYADQRGHVITWMTAEERADMDRVAAEALAELAYPKESSDTLLTVTPKGAILGTSPQRKEPKR